MAAEAHMSSDARHSLELEQIQGLILNGYGHHPAARYAVFEITDAVRARQWLGRLVARLQFGEFRRTARDKPPFTQDISVNVAFSYAGFAALGLHPTALLGFSLPFQEGLADRDRARRLGDDGASDPRRWTWGRADQPVHGLLAVFGRTDGAVGYEAIQRVIDHDLQPDHGVRPLVVLDTTPVDPVLRREHFGFRDGITNPRLRSLAKPGATDQVADGEMLLGYENGYGHMPMSPEVPAETDKGDRLALATDRPARKDFGRNGSYLVFRQLTQDVRAFWQYVYAAKEGIRGIAPGREGAEWLGAKLVGRWPNGTPLARFPDRPGPDAEDDLNDFLYGERGDAFGARCPIGSHIRRTNPRDTTLPVPHDVELSGSPDDPEKRKARLDLTALHRIMRRGRMYGEPADPLCDPDMLRFANEKERGLHFLCFNANLSRQFEFVQSNWALNPGFAGLSKDPDPLIGAQRARPFPAADFTIPGSPTRRIHDLPRVVEVKGGAYFFMPSRGAIEYLAAGG
jgi:Dyp-type peroxidase family